MCGMYMKIKNVALLFILFCLSIGTAFASAEHDAVGTVNSVDKSSKTINITHSAVKSMGMAGMTMDFRVADPAMLGDVHAGQKINFVITTDKRGRFVIVDLE